MSSERLILWAEFAVVETIAMRLRESSTARRHMAMLTIATFAFAAYRSQGRG
jgi:hypothetical protein